MTTLATKAELSEVSDTVGELSANLNGLSAEVEGERERTDKLYTHVGAMEEAIEVKAHSFFLTISRAIVQRSRYSSLKRWALDLRLGWVG